MSSSRSGFSWTCLARDGSARAGLLATAHGQVATPAFMPVATAATVKGITAGQVREAGAGIVLANTYHLMLRPGAGTIARLGGLHRFMDWPGPILTDSGGFQLLSLKGLARVDEEGATFRSHIDARSSRLRDHAPPLWIPRAAAGALYRAKPGRWQAARPARNPCTERAGRPIARAW